MEEKFLYVNPPSDPSNTDPWTNPTLTCQGGKVGIGT